jgi:hypothetical protein
MQDTNLQSIFNKQRSDKFRLILTLPKVLRDLDMKDFTIAQRNLLNSDSLQFSLFGANIPEISVQAKDIAHSGQTMRVTSQTRSAYEPVTCKFSVDNRFKNYWVIWKWLETLNHQRDGRMNSGVSEVNNLPRTGPILDKIDFWGYQTTISLTPLDEYNDSMCEFLFYNAFVTKLSRLDFNYQTADELVADFTFSFGQMDIRIKD